MTGREIPRHPGERHQDPANARTIRARTNSGERRKASGQRARRGRPWWRFVHATIYLSCGRGGGNIPISKPFRTRADRRHNRPAPSSRLQCTATAAPGPGREDRAENTRRTGGRGPGRDFSKKKFMQAPAAWRDAKGKALSAYRFVAAGVIAGDRRAGALGYRPPPQPVASIVKTRPRVSLQVE